MKSINSEEIKELQSSIEAFLRKVDPAEFDDEEGNGGHTRSSAIAEELSNYLSSHWHLLKK